MKLLVDADYVVYKCCASAESEIDFGEDVIVVTSKFSDAYNCVKRELNKIAQNFFDSEIILFFSDSTNFRKSIQPAYKGHRNRKKPCGYKRVINQLKNEYRVVIMPTLEADDALGIYATKHPGNVICSPDKDMRQIPGQTLRHERNDECDSRRRSKVALNSNISRRPNRWIRRMPGLGVKRAAALFEEKGYSWKTVVEAFADKDLSEEVALENARLARILQCTDYDVAEQQPILWTATADYKIDDGAGVQDASD